MLALGSLAATYEVHERKTFSAIMRIRRFKIVNALIAQIIARKGYCRILDVGGSKYYWNMNSNYLAQHRGAITVTLSNLEDVEIGQDEASIFSFVREDATRPEMFEGCYDLVHSNSVIEHVGSWPKVRAMADNITSCGLPYYVQTPNYWFPIEPHFRTLGFQWLPLDVRARMLLSKQRGFHKATSFDEAMLEVESINLLTATQLAILFPGAEIRRERLGPLTKSFMVVGGTT